MYRSSKWAVHYTRIENRNYYIFNKLSSFVSQCCEIKAEKKKKQTIANQLDKSSVSDSFANKRKLTRFHKGIDNEGVTQGGEVVKMNETQNKVRVA